MLLLAAIGVIAWVGGYSGEQLLWLAIAVGVAAILPFALRAVWASTARHERWLRWTITGVAAAAMLVAFAITVRRLLTGGSLIGG